VGPDAVYKKRAEILVAQRDLTNSLLKGVEQQKDRYVINKTKAMIAALDTVDTVDSRAYNMIIQSLES
jgi:hypothetical protein